MVTGVVVELMFVLGMEVHCEVEHVVVGTHSMMEYALLTGL